MPPRHLREIQFLIQIFIQISGGRGYKFWRRSDSANRTGSLSFRKLTLELILTMADRPPVSRVTVLTAYPDSHHKPETVLPLAAITAGRPVSASPPIRKTGSEGRRRAELSAPTAGRATSSRGAADRRLSRLRHRPPGAGAGAATQSTRGRGLGMRPGTRAGGRQAGGFVWSECGQLGADPIRAGGGGSHRAKCGKKGGGWWHMNT